MGMGLKMLEQNHAQSYCVFELSIQNHKKQQYLIQVSSIRKNLERIISAAGNTQAHWGLNEVGFGQIILTMDDLTNPALAQATNESDDFYDNAAKNGFIYEMPTEFDFGAREKLFNNLTSGLVAIVRVQLEEKVLLRVAEHEQMRQFKEELQNIEENLRTNGKEINVDLTNLGISSENFNYFKSIKEYLDLKKTMDSKKNKVKKSFGL